MEDHLQGTWAMMMGQDMFLYILSDKDCKKQIKDYIKVIESYMENTHTPWPC